MRFIYTMEYYSAVNDIMKFEGKLIELEKKNILTEETKIQKDKYGIYSVIYGY